MLYFFFVLKGTLSKTIIRHHYTPFRIAKQQIKLEIFLSSWSSQTLWWDCKLVQVLLKTQVLISQAEELPLMTQKFHFHMHVQQKCYLFTWTFCWNAHSISLILVSGSVCSLLFHSSPNWKLSQCLQINWMDS